MKNNFRFYDPRSYDCTVHTPPESDGVSGLKALVNIGKDRSSVYDLKQNGVLYA